MIILGSLVLSGILGSYLLYKNRSTFAYNLLVVYTNIENSFIDNKLINTKSTFYNIDLESKKIVPTDVLEPLTFCINNKKMYFYAEPDNYMDIEFAFVAINIKINNNLFLDSYDITDFFNNLKVHIDNPISFRNPLVWYLIFKEFININTNSLINNIGIVDVDNVDISYNIVDMEGGEYKLSKFILKIVDGNIKIID